MSVELRDGVVYLTGRCGVEDSEALLRCLVEGASRVDLDGCEGLHTAILQLLLAADREILGGQPGFVARWSLLSASGDTER